MMSDSEQWLLPEGMEELLPEQAEQIEFLRRSLLKLYQRWGYRFVMTPLVEHLESLQVGAGNDISRHTFKLIDEMTGRLLGVRADITPQVSRIDAHRLKSDGPSRLCYAGPVLLTRPRELGGSRNPVQIGAELYGHSGKESDIEILELMLSSLKRTGLAEVSLDLGHVGVFRGLIKHFQIDSELESSLFDALQRKAKPEIEQILNDKDCQKVFVSLASLNGNETILSEAKKIVGGISSDVDSALLAIEEIVEGLKVRCPDVSIHLDFAELRGYQYHTGAIFSAYVPGYWQAIAQGGRYDDVGKVFGRSRAATGFSMDLRAICNMLPKDKDSNDGVFAPCAPSEIDESLEQKIHELRGAGEVVIRELPSTNSENQQHACNRVLVKDGSNWIIKKLESKNE